MYLQLHFGKVTNGDANCPLWTGGLLQMGLFWHRVSRTVILPANLCPLYNNPGHASELGRADANELEQSWSYQQPWRCLFQQAWLCWCKRAWTSWLCQRAWRYISQEAWPCRCKCWHTKARKAENTCSRWRKQGRESSLFWYCNATWPRSVCKSKTEILHRNPIWK